MISYDPFRKTMKEKGISTYSLIKDYHVSSSVIDRLRNDLPISTRTLDDLCRIYDCRVEDILVYIPD